ncbi:SdpI family protein [Bacillus albus]|uniref:SdpI family protein n=1 Tax=Bacillus TaxID=1386 RepID=UPI0014192C8C|nr:MULTISPECIES: SdpI family protein [Bacillus]MBU5218511.1 SdpI family protein [Bacillus albus]MDA2027974.1 SdpI family protein [Bacillus cereus group sp. Bcc03]MDA2217881.1 SdpI family protein [Bacillus cereus group sp. Bc228]MDA2229453.1 SdpI family protein [Bacillus cereus group sp. Bc227]MDA2260825.1 SdpI family protein [Bacillus cereus group sp. Bc200]
MKKHIFPLLLIALTIIAWCAAWPYLPEQIPRHYNAAGMVDGYFSKVEASSFSIGSMVVLYMIWLVFGLIKDKSTQQSKVLSAINYAILLIGFGCNIFALLAASNYIASGSIAFNFGLGTLFLVLGNYMQQTKPNGLVGIRMDWTLENPVVWRKTHRFASKVFVIGAFCIYAGALLPDPFNIFMGIGMILICLFISTIKSYVIYKKELKM